MNFLDAKAAKMRSFFEILPEEILEQILLRLPPKSLKCCKWVCKHWYDTITHPEFIEKQLHVSRENKRHSSPATLCFLWERKELSKKEVFTGRYENNDLKKQVLSMITIHKDEIDGGNRIPCLIKKIKLPRVRRAEKKDFPSCFSATHCNGITCFYDCYFIKDTVFFCNTELRELKLLRTPCMGLLLMFSGAGFGYDCKAREYKFVKFFSAIGSQKESRALVHTLGTDSSQWREIDLKGMSCWLGRDAVYCRGFNYWRNSAVQGSASTILALDMSEERIHRIELPPIAQRPSGKIFKLTVWNDMVAIFISTELSRRSSSFEMWVMVQNFDGVEGFTYWNKHLTIGPLTGILFPLSFWKDDELLMATKHGRIVSCNIHTRKLKLLSIPERISRSSTSCISCLKSLVSVRR